MGYEIFISYTSDDRPWAQKLERDLTAAGVECFLDKTRIDKGKPWEPQLLGALTGSQHFVLLWSEKARQSDWVQQELYRFKGEIDPKALGQPVPGRLLIPINLEGRNATLSSLQAHEDKTVQEAYKAGDPDQPSAQPAWDAMVTAIVASVKADGSDQEVPVAILALTTGSLEVSPPRKPPLSFAPGPGVDDFLTSIGAGKISDLAGRYGLTPLDWRPYGSTETMRELLTKLLEDPHLGVKANLRKVRNPLIRWKHVDLVSPPLDHLSLEQFASGPCLVVIDPVSLFSDDILQRYEALQDCFHNPQAAIVFPTVVGGDDRFKLLRQCLAHKPHLQWFHSPIPHKPDYANCGINVADKWDISRLVLASLGKQPYIRPSSGSPILGFGGLS